MINKYTPRDVKCRIARLPKGTLTLQHFGSKHGVGDAMYREHVFKGRGGEHPPVTKIPYKGRTWFFVTPAQQKAALAFWERHNVFHWKEPHDGNYDY
jgi:hypothetical protein